MERILKLVKTEGDRNSIIGCVLNLDVTAVRLSTDVIITSTQYDKNIRLIKLFTSTKSVKIYLDREDVTSLRSTINHRMNNLHYNTMQVYYDGEEWHIGGLDDPFAPPPPQPEEELY